MSWKRVICNNYNTIKLNEVKSQLLDHSPDNFRILSESHQETIAKLHFF